MCTKKLILAGYLYLWDVNPNLERLDAPAPEDRIFNSLRPGNTKRGKVGVAGLEPPTYGLEVRRLSFEILGRDTTIYGPEDWSLLKTVPSRIPDHDILNCEWSGVNGD